MRRVQECPKKNAPCANLHCAKPYNRYLIFHSKKLHCANPYSIKKYTMQGIGMLTKVPYIKTYTMQGHPVQGLTVLSDCYCRSRTKA